MEATSKEQMWDVVWPRSNRTMTSLVHARRLDTLEGKTICELWTWGFRGDEMFPIIEQELVKRYGNVKFVRYDVLGSIHGPDEGKALAALPDKLKQYKCDAVIAGVGC